MEGFHVITDVVNQVAWDFSIWAIFDGDFFGTSIKSFTWPNVGFKVHLEGIVVKDCGFMS